MRHDSVRRPAEITLKARTHTPQYYYMLFVLVLLATEIFGENDSHNHGWLKLIHHTHTHTHLCEQLLSNLIYMKWWNKCCSQNWAETNVYGARARVCVRRKWRWHEHEKCHHLTIKAHFNRWRAICHTLTACWCGANQFFIFHRSERMDGASRTPYTLRNNRHITLI